MKKKILLILALVVMAVGLYAQDPTGSNWIPIRLKQNVSDSAYYKKDVRFAAGVRLKGATSGYTKLIAPAVAGTVTVTMPSTTGVLATTQNINDTVDAWMADASVGIELADSTGVLEGNYMPRLQTAELVNDSLITLRTTVPLIYSAAGDTSNYPIPDKIGDIFIDTSASKVYVSKTAARNGWLILNMIVPFIYFRRKKRNNK